MNRLEAILKTLTYILIIGITLCSCDQDSITINDFDGIMGETNAPISITVQLNKEQLKALDEGRLGLVNLSAENETTLPVQMDNTDEESSTRIIFQYQNNSPGSNQFKFVINKNPFLKKMDASVHPNSKQLIVSDQNNRVLQYNYQTVFQKDVIRPESKKDAKLVYSNMSGVYYDEYLKANPEVEKNNTTTSSIYSVPRSDYIHPIYGLNGEMLTRDWPDGGHPHHRGIFWAWPEVEYGSQRADIYALQRVFARPTGNVSYTGGPVFAEIDAENLWMWNDEEAIVKEQAIIRVYKSTPENRIIDLTIKLLALKDSVTIATRFTNSYGGLNIRMQTPEKQDISYFTDKPDAVPIRAWSDFNGIFEGNKSTSGLMVLQHQDNPEYPGAWRDYPNLAWVQPTFPTPETRYSISKEEPLVLRFRLIIHAGGKPSEDISKKNWDVYHSKQSPL